ncbi:MAG: DUF192 domain-containing protein [Actinomycetota bacterium]
MVAEAQGPVEKMRGLIGSKGLAPATGLLLRARQVHTFGMSFAIDTVHLAADGKVLRIRTMKPGRLGRVVYSARWVLELQAGEASRLGIIEGTRLVRESS